MSSTCCIAGLLRGKRQRANRVCHPWNCIVGGVRTGGGGHSLMSIIDLHSRPIQPLASQIFVL